MRATSSALFVRVNEDAGMENTLSVFPQHSTLHLYAPPEFRQWTINSLRLWNCAQSMHIHG